MTTRFRLAGALLALTLCAQAQAAAPTFPGPDRLPADTWVLINWHGVDAATRVQATNPVMKLWSDPQFASAREQLVRMIATSVARDEGLDAALSRGAIDDVLSLLENPVTMGVAGDPLAPAPADGRGNVHFYAVLNKKGKEAEWGRLNKDDKPGANAQVSTYTFRGVQVKRTVKTTPPAAPVDGSEADPQAQPKVSHSLAASFGDYELLSDHQPLMEALITRLQATQPAAAGSLLGDTTYQRAQKFRADGPLFEAFVKVPDVSRAPIPPQPQIDMAAALRELHLERIKGLWLSAGMGRERMVVRGALLGDFAPGSILDVVGGNGTSFQTLSAAPVHASYGAFRIDLPALYATLLRAVKAGLPPDQAAAATMLVDSTVAMQTGMRTADLLALFSGEIGVISTGEDPVTGLLPGVLMLPSARGDAVLGLIRTLAGGLVQGEEKIAGSTVLRIGLPAQPQGGETPLVEPFLVAVTPSMVMVGAGKSALQAAVARSAGRPADSAAPMAADRTFQAARRTLPAELNGLNYIDVKRFQWDAQVAQLRQMLATSHQATLQRADEMEKGGADVPADAEGARKLREGVKSSQSLMQAIEVLFPLLPKHLRTSTGGSWKAADGLFFDSFVD